MIFLLSLFFIILSSTVEAATYYVATTGNNAVSCATAQNIATPKQTIQGGLTCLTVGGDTLYIRAGTYTAGITGTSTVPANGSGTTYTTIAGYPGDLPTKPKILSNHTVSSFRGVYLDSTIRQFHHIEFRDIEFDGVYDCYRDDFFAGGTQDSFNIHMYNTICHDTYNVGFFFANKSASGSTTGNHHVRGNLFYNIGVGQPGYAPGMNAIYGTGSNTIIEDNTFHNVCAGIAVYDSQSPPAGLQNVIVRRNLFYQVARKDLDTWQTGSACGPAFGALSLGTGHQFYNNIVYDSANRAMSLYGATTNSKFYNNTIYNQTTDCCDGVRDVTGLCALVESNVGTGNEFRNNICRLTAGLQFDVAVTNSNNLTATDPLFVNAASHDFHLQSGSPARDAGFNVSATLTTDYDNVTRVLPYDIGAFEFAAPAGDLTPPSAPTGLAIQ